MHMYQKGIELRGSSALNYKSYQKVICLRRCMAVTTAATITGAIVFIIAVLLPNWAIINFLNTDGAYVNVKLGVWGEWRTLNTTGVGKEVVFIYFFKERF